MKANEKIFEHMDAIMLNDANVFKYWYHRMMIWIYCKML